MFRLRPRSWRSSSSSLNILSLEPTNKLESKLKKKKEEEQEEQEDDEDEEDEEDEEDKEAFSRLLLLLFLLLLLLLLQDLLSSHCDVKRRFLTWTTKSAMTYAAGLSIPFFI